MKYAKYESRNKIIIMFTLLGTVIFGVGTSLGAKVIIDKVVYGRSKKEHTRMIILSGLFMIIGEGLKRIEKMEEKYIINNS